MNEVDIYVGRRIRDRREEVGLRQVQLAMALNLRPQTLQKYETGQNRMNAPQLWRIAQVLKVRIDYFFKGFGDERSEHESGPDEMPTIELDGSSELAKHLRELEKLEVPQREAIFALVQSMANQTKGIG